MSAIYCTKCGARGDSKCPHCRSIFQSHPKDPRIDSALESIEMRIGYKQDEEPGKDGKAKFQVSFWTYAPTGDEAMARILRILQDALAALPPVVLAVASCDHDWQLMPGVESEIWCGHIGPERPVPPDPFA